ncbi:MAG: sugar transferase [Saccharofermentanales bacterium]|jgi:undecaprenyl phosphate N,N'-diacetylbacillosamine 1-phosphate transferase
MYRKFGKRWLDVVCSGLLLVILSPMLLMIAVLVRCKLGSPVFFKQTRPGKNEQMFDIIKFRTMINAFDASGEPLPDKERVTRFGMFLRTSSLDELPELWCILRGDMSFVGPRPLSKLYLPYYTEREAVRHCVRPGLTGLAQINGRNALGWDERLALDVEYVDTLSFMNDMRIIWKTVLKVLRKDDVILAGTGSVGDLDEIRDVQRPKYLDKT